jgi:hypothetical protein
LTLTQTVLTRWRAYGATSYFLLKLQDFGINFQKSLQFFFILTLLNIGNQLVKSFQQTRLSDFALAACRGEACEAPSEAKPVRERPL